MHYNINVKKSNVRDTTYFEIRSMSVSVTYNCPQCYGWRKIAHIYKRDGRFMLNV